jgi:hypothetical protein
MSVGAGKIEKEIRRISNPIREPVFETGFLGGVLLVFGQFY